MSENDLFFVNRGGAVWACWLSGRPAVNLGSADVVCAAFHELMPPTAISSERTEPEPPQPTVAMQEADHASLPSSPPAYSERKEARYDLTVAGRIYTSSGQREVTVLDLSCEGCRFHEPNGTLRKDSKLTIRFGTIGPIGASVRWRERDHVGISFDAPLYPSVMEHIREHMDLRR